MCEGVAAYMTEGNGRVAVNKKSNDYDEEFLVCLTWNSGVWSSQFLLTSSACVEYHTRGVRLPRPTLQFSSVREVEGKST